ncbi:hypothetical protein AeMF1_006957 [Aphanomyces euteiches]|nr:hypothetical protein AeMF1_014347 [Aphanomyces euteiches]KAH9121226.1 hypothetical protein AeMF1_006957 [Aphanomyces euteiches]KAH9192552.1 hypothetical protein AeNC1_005470 [Aphanomyces euteiches]
MTEALFQAVTEGDVEQVQALLDAGEADVNAVRKVKKEDYTPIMHAAENGDEDMVRMLLNRPDIDINSCAATVKKNPIMRAAKMGYVSVVNLLWERVDDQCREQCIDTALNAHKMEVVAALIENGSDYSPRYGGKLLLKSVAPYLSLDGLVLMLMRDLPFEILPSGEISPRSEGEDYYYTWTTFLTPEVCVDESVSKEAVVDELLAQKSFEGVSRISLVKNLVFAKDEHGREAHTIADRQMKSFLERLSYFLNRYEIFEGPPTHVSATAVVVLAYDHGICKQVFNEYANEDGTLSLDGFVKCNETLGRLNTHRKASQKKYESEYHLWEKEFELWDTDNDDTISEDEFERYCLQHFGGKIKVAMKFMRNVDEYEREIATRRELDTKFVLSLLPKPNGNFEKDIAALNINGNLPLENYPHLLVMPAADRSLEDIFLKERPSEHQIRYMLQEVALALDSLHSRGFVHGDLKKLNILRVNNLLKIIDFDATTPIGQPVGSKFSSGILPPEMFYKLKNEDEKMMHRHYWKSQSDDIRLWNKVKPKEKYVVRAFTSCNTHGLPYSLVHASESLDLWSFGCLMYQMLSGLELVSTDVNQDVAPDRIKTAATWTDEKLLAMIEAHVVNEAARDLLAKLLVVNPERRIGLKEVLEHHYFTGGFDSVLEKNLDALSTQAQEQCEQLSRIAEAQRENALLISQMSSAKALLLEATKSVSNAIYDAIEAVVPTSFVCFPFRLTRDGECDKAFEDTVNFIPHFRTICNIFSESVVKGEAIGGVVTQLYRGESLYLYLIDEVTGHIVLPEDDPLYPIEVQSHDTAFLAMSLPLIQGGLDMLIQNNGVLGMLSRIGFGNSRAVEINEQIVEVEEQVKKDIEASSQSLHKALTSSLPAKQVRGAMLRELKHWFDDHDPDQNYAGLQRVMTNEGRVLWTTKPNAETIRLERRSSREAISDMSTMTLRDLLD